MVIHHKNIDVNARCQKLKDNCTNIEMTVLGYVCDTQCDSTLGVKMLLEDKRTDVNKIHKTDNTPLFYALHKIEAKDDYFYQVAKMLLNHHNIDVNVKCSYLCDDPALSELAESDRCKSNLGVQLLLDDPRIHIYKQSPAYWAAYHGQPDILELILNYPDHDVNKVCCCCNNFLPMAAIENVQSLNVKEGRALKIIIDAGAKLNLIFR